MTTTCQKCGGLLVAERPLDFYNRSARWKCINCGWSLLEGQQPNALVDRATRDCSRKNRSH